MHRMGRPWKIREAAGKSRDTVGKSRAAERAKTKNGGLPERAEKLRERAVNIA